MRRRFTCAILLSVAGLTWSALGGQNAPAKKSSTKSSAAKKAPATTWRNRQLAPTPARYKEIQQALLAKGYLQPGDATGQWSQASVEALKRFQADQNLAGSGKINSLSLIALGLGPKRENASVSKPLPPAQQ